MHHATGKREFHGGFPVSREGKAVRASGVPMPEALRLNQRPVVLAETGEWDYRLEKT